MDRFRFATRLITPPEEDVVSVDQARRNCSVDDTEHDETLAELIQQARNYCEENTDVCLLTTVWEITCDAFPAGAGPIVLPRWPLQGIVGVYYIDSAGDEQSIELADLSLRIDDLGRGRLSRVRWAAWPATLHTPDAVRIRFTAGWQTPEDVPAVWTRAQLMLIAWWFEQREAGVLGTIAAKAPIGIDDLIQSAATVDDFDEFEVG